MMTRRGSIPSLVMRTGMIQPFAPADARADIDAVHVLNVTAYPGTNPLEAMTPPMPSPTVVAVSQCVTAKPPAPIQVPVERVPSPSARESQKHAWMIHHARKNPTVEAIKQLHPNAPLHGSDPAPLPEVAGRPVAKFEIAASPPAPQAHRAVAALHRAASILRQTGLTDLPPELVGGPLAALMRGGVVDLHFQNGVVKRTAL